MNVKENYGLTEKGMFNKNIRNISWAKSNKCQSDFNHGHERTYENESEASSYDITMEGSTRIYKLPSRQTSILRIKSFGL